MIKLQKNSFSNSKNLVYNEFHPNQKFGYACLSYYPAECDEISKINAHILDSILKFNLENFSKEEIKEPLEEFFIQLNWRLYSMFKQTNGKEKGISFILIINFDDKLLIIPFGRFLCGIWDENGLTELGNEWENFQVKSMQELKLLGNLAQNLKPNIIEHHLLNNTGLTIIPAHKNHFAEFNNLNEILNHLNSSEETFPHIILSNGVIKNNKSKKILGKLLK
ncbi:MAG: hypothetical protein KAS49_04900 [Candidatus Cloacimonetes bacterium]|nr:hypothetical protein [Candidatus Cloacimonadota bacterium]